MSTAPAPPVQKAPTPPRVQAATGPAARKPSLLARATATTPGTLRLLLALTALAAVVFGVVAQQAGALQARAATTAREQSAQLLGVQNVRTLLVDANAIAANTFLVGGREPAELRASYVTSLSAAASGIAELSASDSVDTGALASVASRITTYSGLIEQARANNRQGFPVASAYLDQASAVLSGSDGILRELDGLVTSGADRVAAAYDAVRWSILLLIGSLVMLLVLIAAQLWLARRTHRYVNRPLATGTALLLVFGIGGALAYGSTAANVGTARVESYREALTVSNALIAASDAKSLESFTLIKRGSGAALEERYQEAVASVRQKLTGELKDALARDRLVTEFEQWQTFHQEIRKADDAGEWNQAVSTATATGAGRPNDLFTTFSVDARKVVQEKADAASSTLDSGAQFSSVVSWILLAAGLAAAVLAWRGVSQRLEEYR
ncbi:hypothetical protein [Rathayibacter iranicus]|uniref:Chemotaxis methyl-accepting receptor HlyB-like 4HB MCP domain-containing protein n=2 Tax=Rathayibacter iranicus TaxID=59737 RepID=A0AAD1EMJ8_9MICO|nr:hypothetical protein [Rathayibacter iranicus]AZZ56187.1 hypothetical protein C7V51_10035 [Rathayibacter iranicus]MWV30114.1 hypothetical protein [Rathayibacter iranicus NCPPB 2253 = VKM Ac-1602]PPI46254.1 hypothetical protein C5E09_09025 [Rathayibacter iranicus]PPI59629.1 hypothetical protein C5E08_09950 [Rathayibacter iranicus]PPI71106.1 hypothetical protein C5E01_08990 [Rathayibacter iranicus]